MYPITYLHSVLRIISFLSMMAAIQNVLYSLVLAFFLPLFCWWKRKMALAIFVLIMVKDGFPIPIVEDLLDEVFGSSYFSKLHLRSGYHLILVSLMDSHKTTFWTHQGFYEWMTCHALWVNYCPSFFLKLDECCFQRPIVHVCIGVFLWYLCIDLHGLHIFNT